MKWLMRMKGLLLVVGLMKAELCWSFVNRELYIEWNGTTGITGITC
jgi:hypothetical protein